MSEITPNTQAALQDEAFREKFNRLFWHSRRGMLELDVLLVPFLRQVYVDLSPEDQAKYERLLNCEDTELFQWFMQKSEPEDPEHNYMVKMILDRVQPD